MSALLLLACAASLDDKPDPPGAADTGASADTAGCVDGADGDGDGFEDCDEIACASDPEDPGEWCYACGWPHNDPGTWTSTGDDVGDVIRNVLLLDACGEWVDLWDFGGSYWLVMITTGWCESCFEEAEVMPEHQERFRTESGIADFGYMVILYQDAWLNGADDADAADFAAATGVDGLIPVLSDPTEGIIDDVPWYNKLPGKCALTPEMEILHCYAGADDSEALALIQAHAAR